MYEHLSAVEDERFLDARIVFIPQCAGGVACVDPKVLVGVPLAMTIQSADSTSVAWTGTEHRAFLISEDSMFYLYVPRNKEDWDS